MRDERLVKLAELLVGYSTNVKAGDKVSIKAEDAALPFIIEVAKAAIKKGAFVDYSVTVPEVEEAILKFGDEKQLSMPNNDYGLAVKESDVWITAWGSKNSRARSNISPQLLQKRRIANSTERKIYVDRCASGDLRWCGTQFPTNAEAQNTTMKQTLSLNSLKNATVLFTSRKRTSAYMRITNGKRLRSARKNG